MRYRVLIHPEAEVELEDAYWWIAHEAASQAIADKWKAQLLKKARSLRQFPERCAIAPEGRLMGEPIRQLLCGPYRLLFVIDERTVTVLHVRHSARRHLGEGEEE